MRRRRLFLVTLLLSSCLTTGCWDRMEVNDLAIDMGAGIDYVKPGRFMETKQFIIPSKISSSEAQIGASKKAYFITSSTGTDISECIEKNQTRLSRRIFVSHRRNLFIGEDMAKYGVKRVIDIFNRDPKNRLRTDLWVVKGGDAHTLLQLDYPFEFFPAIAASKIYKATGGPVGQSYLNFLVDAESDVTYPSLPVMELVPGAQRGDDGTEPTINFGGRAIFDKNLRLLGYIPFEEAVDRFWVLGRLPYGVFQISIPGQQGDIGMDVTHIKSKIRTRILPNHKVEINLELRGTGLIRENNTDLDVSQPDNISKVEQVVNKQVSSHVLRTIHSVQQQFGADVFNFGESMHRQHPIEWEQLRYKWKDKFLNADVHVSVHITIRQVGLVGPPLSIKGDEVKS